LVALAFLSLIKSFDFNLAKLECIKLHQTELRSGVWAKWASFYGLCSELIFIKSTRHLKTTLYSQAKMLGGLCASKVRVFVFCVFLQPPALMFQKAPI
jgi:hypothetical protein